MSHPKLQDFVDWAAEFSHDNAPGQPVDGEYYDLPDTTVYTTYTQPLEGKGRIELNLTNPEVQKNFNWKAEITLDDIESGVYKHILLQQDGDIVETYGKQVNQVDQATAETLLTQLKKLTGSRLNRA